MRILSTFYLFILLVAALSSPVCLQAQTVKQLEEQRKAMLREMEVTNKILSETQKSQRSSVNKLTVLNKSILERKNLIASINREIAILDDNIRKLNEEKDELEKQLELLRGDYAKLVQEAYLNRNSYSKLMFLFSAKNTDQTIRRLRYMQEYSSYRKEQVAQIEKTKTGIALKNDSLQRFRTEKLQVIQNKQTEANKLTTDENKEKRLYGNLQKKERELRNELKDQQKKADALNKRIEKLIAEEINKAEKKAGKPAPGKKADPLSILTKEQQLIAGNFEKNKGRLPWPIEKGFISGKYGLQSHPVLVHVKTNNKGVYLQTPSGSNARVVFEGTVTQRFSIPGSNNAVIVQHGNYRTVYANLTEIYVKEGDKVSAKQAIGKIYVDKEDDNKTELYFQVWKNTEIQNPEMWITK